MANVTDYSLANQTGLAFRTELNSILGEVQSLNDGTTAPTTLVAHKLWMDTTGAVQILKLRDYANTGWNTLFDPAVQTIDSTTNNVGMKLGNSSTAISYLELENSTATSKWKFARSAGDLMLSRDGTNLIKFTDSLMEMQGLFPIDLVPAFNGTCKIGTSSRKFSQGNFSGGVTASGFTATTGNISTATGSITASAGNISITVGTLRLAKGADRVASSSMNIITGNSFTVTGNSTINDIDTVKTGTEITLIFTGTPLIPHSASLIMPSGLGYQVTAGDVLKFLETATGVWTCTSIQSAIGTGTGDALVANPLSQFAATTSLQLKDTISDETGSGALVFATSPTLVTPALGTPSSGALGSCTAYEGTAVASTGEAGGTKYLREDGDGTCSWQTVAGSGDMILASVQTITGAKTFEDLTCKFENIAQTFSTTLRAGASTATRIVVLPDESGTLTYTTGTYAAMSVGKATNIAGGAGGSIPYQSAANTTALLANGTAGQVLQSNGTTLAPSWAAAGAGDALTTNGLDQFAATTSLELKGVISDETGSGALVFGTSPTLITPVLGTPASGDLSNCTALGFAGFDTDVADTMGFANGAYLDDFTLVVTSNGTVITATFDSVAGGDVRVLFDDGVQVIDTDPTAKTVALTAGTDSVPQRNYIYFLHSTNLVTANTTGFPDSDEMSPIADVLVQSAASVQTYGVYKNHVWNDHMKEQAGGLCGHLSHMNHWIRHQHATYIDGVAQTLTITPASPDTVIFTTTSGSVLQLHHHDFPAFSGTPDIYVVNDNTTPYTRVTDLASLLTDSAGASLSGKYFSLVIWGSVNQDTGDCKLYCNLPSGSYNGSSDATNDISSYSNFTIPSSFKGTGFLISRLTLRHQTSGGGDWTSIEEADLRGLFPATSPGSGGSGGTGDLLADGTVPLTANWDVGAFDITAEQFHSDITTGTAPFTVASTTEVANLKAATATLADTVTTNADLTGAVTSSGNATTLKVEIGIAVSDETTDLTTGTAKTTFRMPYAMTVTGVRANVNTAPTGSTIIVDINDGGATIMTTNKLSIDATEKTSETAATAPGITDTALADDAEITIDIDQVGSTIAGKGLKVWLIGTRTA